MSNEEATDQPKWGTICTLIWLELPWDGIAMEVKTIPKWNKLDNWRQKTILTNPNPFMTSLESPVEFYRFLLLRKTGVRVIFLTLSLKWRYWWEFSWRSHERCHIWILLPNVIMVWIWDISSIFMCLDTWSLHERRWYHLWDCDPVTGVGLQRVRKNLKVMLDSGASPSSVLSDSPRHEKMLPHTCALRIKPSQLLFFPCNDGLYNWNCDAKETRFPLCCFVRYFVTTVRKVMNKDDLKMLTIGERWERML